MPKHPNVIDAVDPDGRGTAGNGDSGMKGGHAAHQFATLDKGLTRDAGDFQVI